MMAFAIDSEVRGCHICKDFWRTGHEILLSKVYNHKDWYAITHARFNALKSSRDADFCYAWESIFVESQLPGIYFQRGRLLRNIRK